MMIQMSCMGVIERDGMNDAHYLWAYDRSDVENIERRGMDAYSRFLKDEPRCHSPSSEVMDYDAA